jgi:DNA polymerase-3 subunit epsilon
VLEATHARPRLVLVPHPRAARVDAFWLVGGRLVDWGPPPAGDELVRRTARALARAERGTGTFLPSEEIDEVRIVSTWLAGRDDLPALDLSGGPDPAVLETFVAGALAARAAA